MSPALRLASEQKLSSDTVTGGVCAVLPGGAGVVLDLQLEHGVSPLVDTDIIADSSLTSGLKAHSVGTLDNILKLPDGNLMEVQAVTVLCLKSVQVQTLASHIGQVCFLLGGELFCDHGVSPLP